MATKRTAGTRVLSVEITTELREYIDQYSESRDETLRKIVERALKAEFRNPPPLTEEEPLPKIAQSPSKRKPTKAK